MIRLFFIVLGVFILYTGLRGQEKFDPVLGSRHIVLLLMAGE